MYYNDVQATETKNHLYGRVRQLVDEAQNNVPSRRDEAARDYLRFYEDVKMDLRKAKQRLVHFLNRHEIRCESGKRTWTDRYWKWLRTLEFDSVIDRETFDEYLAHVGHLEEKRGRIANQIEQIATEPEYEKSVAHLGAFRGIGTLTARAVRIVVT